MSDIERDEFLLDRAAAAVEGALVNLREGYRDGAASCAQDALDDLTEAIALLEKGGPES